MTDMPGYGLRVRLDSAVFPAESGDMVLSPVASEAFSRPGIVRSADLAGQPLAAFKVVDCQPNFFFFFFFCSCGYLTAAASAGGHGCDCRCQGFGG